MSSSPEQFAPAPVLVDGIKSPLSSLLVRAAHERDDVEIVGVVKNSDDKDVDFDTFSYLLEHHSVYGRSPDLAETVRKYESPKEVDLGYANFVNVSPRGRISRIAADYGYGSDVGSVITANGKSGEGRHEEKQPLIAIPGLGDWVYNGHRPLFVPDARLHAVVPLLDRLDGGFGLVHADVVEMRSYSEPQALVDQASSETTLPESFAASLGSITLPEETLPTLPYDEKKLFGRKFNNFGDIHEKMTERRFSIPTAVGSRAVVSTLFEDRCDVDVFLEAISPLFVQKETALFEVSAGSDQIMTTRSVARSPLSAHVDLDSVVANDHHASFSMSYDSDWSRVNRILDIAAIVYNNRSR